MIAASAFGALSDGTPVTRYRLGDEAAHVDILDYGATIQSLVVPDRDGVPTDVVLGYNDIKGYETGTCFFGATVGRHANRIGGGAFTLNGKTYSLAKNSGPNHLHGGPEGFDRRMFQAELLGDTLKLSLVSPDGDQGYPGALRLSVYFSFSEDMALTIRYEAVSDQDTVVNLTNHSYFDLSGGRNPRGQLLTLDADEYTENDENTLPTGVISPVAGTPFDFRQEKPVGQDLDAMNQQLLYCRGYDHNFVLKNGGQLTEFARLRSRETGIAMTAATDMPGVQLYGANFVEEQGKGSYQPYCAVCLETQFFPNGMGVAHFPKPLLRAGDTWRHETVYRFEAE